ncbi:MAG: flagellin [Planctomycetota bacterium]
MAVAPLTSRTADLLSSQLSLQQLQQTQSKLLEAQRQSSTGLAVEKPSDEPARVATILTLKNNVAERDQVEKNLQFGINVLDTADQALGDASDILREAASVASSQIGIGSDAETRAVQANVIEGALQGLITAANRQYADLSVFGGNNGARPEGLIFEEFLGGVRYFGGVDDLEADFGTTQTERFTTNGQDAFGALSTRVLSQVDLDPQAAVGTKVADINGAQNAGVRKGTIRVIVNGTQATVDLNTIDSLGDVTTRVNEAINSIDPLAGNLAVVGGSFRLAAGPGDNIIIEDFAGGQAAADLGILFNLTGTVAAGQDLGVRLTEDSLVANFGAPVDLVGGLTITHGAVTKTADFSTATTVQDLQNIVDELNLGLRLEVNSTATGLNLRSEVSGIELSVGEAGGTTAEDLGLRTFGLQTRLDAFRNGLGVQTEAGENDIAITLHDGRSFEVDLSSAVDVEDVINTVNAAATAAGVTVGTDFSIDLVGSGNGFTLTDNTVGATDFAVTNLGLSIAADHLGIKTNAGAGTTITGTDNAKVRVENAFTHLMDLRDALKNNDETGITVAGGKLNDDVDSVVQARAVVGIQANRLTEQSTLNQDQKITESALLSELQDADLTEVLTRFQELQLQYEASLRVASSNLQLSLLDFLR